MLSAETCRCGGQLVCSINLTEGFLLMAAVLLGVVVCEFLQSELSWWVSAGILTEAGGVACSQPRTSFTAYVLRPNVGSKQESSWSQHELAELRKGQDRPFLDKFEASRSASMQVIAANSGSSKIIRYSETLTGTSFL